MLTWRELTTRLTTLIAFAFHFIATWSGCRGSSDASTRKEISTGFPSVSMLSRGQVYHVIAGGKVSLDCEFNMNEFRMFDNPIVWEKGQLDERSRMNIMGVVHEPFAALRRFELDFQNQPPRYRMRLKIRDVVQQDTGNYTCEVRGKKSTVLSNVTHVVYVHGPLTSLFMTTEPPINVNESRPVSSLTVKDGDSVSVWCVSRGGCPSPEMTIHLGDTDVAYVFQRTRQSVEMTGERGFRLLQCTSTRWTTTLKLREYHDGKSLRCKVNSGPNHKEANWTDIQLYVQYAPLIRCNPTPAHTGDRDVYMECVVRSRPDTTVVYWVIDANGTMISSSDMTNDYWTQNRVGGDGLLVTQLFVRVVTPDSFRRYTLVAENALGTTTHMTQLDSANTASSISSPHSSTKRIVWQDSISTLVDLLDPASAADIQPGDPYISLNMKSADEACRSRTHHLVWLQFVFVAVLSRQALVR